eukprot:scaffold13088_cov33-Cyclotella_meneghiniana.AAC.4
MAQEEKRRRRVCLSWRDSNRWETWASTLEMAESMNLVAKSGDPTGWPRTRRPVVTSTGAVALGSRAVGAGVLEKEAMACWIWVAMRRPYSRRMAGSAEVLLVELRMRVLMVLM